MSNVNLRSQKGAPLTFDEVDGNFLALVEAINSILVGQIFTDNAIAENAGINPTKIAGTAVTTNDPRLSDTRTPTQESVTDAEVAEDAGIDPTKIAGTAVTTNDPRLSDTRTPTQGSVTDAEVAEDAEIAGTKITPDFGDQDITTTGGLRAAGVATSNGLATFLRESPVQVDTSSTLSAANLRAGVIVSAPEAEITLTLPTGASLETALPGAYAGMTFLWSLINTASAHDVLIDVATNHALVGGSVVTGGSSTLFLTRRAAGSGNFTSYRVA